MLIEEAREVGGVDPATGDDLVTEMPEYVDVIMTAKYLGVAPWELAAQPYYWTVAAGIVAEAEHEAQQKAHEVG